MSKYKLTFKGLDTNRDFVSKVESMLTSFGYNQHQATFGSDGDWTAEYIDYESLKNGDKTWLIWVDYRNKIVEKFEGEYRGLNNNFSFEEMAKLTPRELKMFDAFGFQCSYRQENETEQSIEDWFGEESE